jgi:hypothetical protein
MIFMDFVNLVKYKIYMDNKNNANKGANETKIIVSSEHKESNNSGIYIRDDHCDWGSSGMNEFTNEFGKD